MDIRSDAEIKSAYLASVGQEQITNAINDAAKFVAIFENLNNLQSVVEAHPERKDAIFRALMLHAIEESQPSARSFHASFMRCSYDFIKLATIFPENKSELFFLILQLDNFDEFINYSGGALTNLAKVFNDQLMLESLIEKSGINTRIGLTSLIVNAYSLTEFAAAFPGQKEMLYTQVLNDETERRRLIKTNIDLLVLGVAFPAQHASLLEPILGNIIEFNRFITSTRELNELADTFPAHHAEIMRVVLNNSSLRTRLIPTSRKLAELGNKYRSCQSALIKASLTDSADYFCYIQSLTDLLELGEAFPANHAEILRLVLVDHTLRARLIEDIAALITLAKVFTNYRSALIDPILYDPIRYSHIVGTPGSLFILGKHFPEYASRLEPQKLVEETTTRADSSELVVTVELLRDLRLMIEPVANPTDKQLTELDRWQDLRTLGNVYPQHQASLLQRFLRSQADWDRLIDNVEALCQLSLAFPTHHATLLEPVLTDNSICRRLNLDCADLINLGRAFPDFKTKLITVALSNPIDYKRIICNTRYLPTLREVYVEDESTLLKPLFTEPAVCAELITNVSDLVVLGDAFPKFRAKLIEPIISDLAVWQKLIDSHYRLATLARSYPEYHAGLLNPVLINSELHNLFITDRSDLAYLGKAFPAQQAELLTPVLKHKTLRAKFMSSCQDLVALSTAFPNYHAALLDQVLNDPNEYNRVITSHEDLANLILAFPNFQTRLMRPILTYKAERARLIPTGAGLAKLCVAVPHYRAELFRPVMYDPGEYRRLVNSVKDLAELGFAFPSHQGALFGLSLRDDVNRPSFIRNGAHANLVALGIAFPNKHAALLKPILDDATKFSHVVTSNEQLASLGLAFPAYQSDLLRCALNTPTMRATYIQCGRDLAELGRAFPTQHSALLSPVLADPSQRRKIISNNRNLKLVCAEFPEQQTELMRLILTDPVERARFINDIDDVLSFHDKFPSVQDALIGTILANPDEYRRIISTGSDLERLAVLTPNQDEALFRPLIKDQALRTKLISDCDVLVKLAKICPDQCLALLYTIFSNPHEYWRIVIVNNNLVELGRVFPAHHQAILRPILTDKTEWSKLITKKDDLETLGSMFPTYLAELLEPVLYDKIQRPRIIKTISDLISIIKRFPAFKAELLRPLLIDRMECSRLIIDCNTMKEFTDAFPEHKAEILNPVLTDSSERNRFIMTSRELLAFCQTFPGHQAALLKPLLTNSHELRRLFASFASLEEFLIYFPEHKEALLAMVKNDEEVVEKITTSAEDCASALRLMPKLRAKTANLFLTRTDEHFTSTFPNSDNIVSACGLFSEYAEQFYARVARIGFQRFGVFTQIQRLERFIKYFPAHRNELIDYLFDNSNLIIELVRENQLGVVSLIKLFPGRRHDLLIFAAGCMPNQVWAALESFMEENEDADILMLSIEELEPTSSCKEAARSQLVRLKNEFVKSNKMLTQFQQRDLNTTLSKYSERIMNLIIIIGPTRALTFLATMTTCSVKQLEQFLNSYSEILVAEVNELLNSIISRFTTSLENKDMMVHWKNIFLTLSTLETHSLNDDLKKKIKVIIAELEHKSLPYIASKVAELAISVSVELLGLVVDPSEVDLAKLHSLTSSRFWTNLIVGVRNFSNHAVWYKAMLECDITRRSLDNLLHNTKQTNTSTKVIAVHNANIRRELDAAGVHADKAIYYRNTHAFTYTEIVKNNTDLELLANKLIDNLEAAHTMLEQSNSISDKHVKGLYNDIGKLLNELTKGKNWVNQLTDRIKSPVLWKLMTDLQSKLKKHNDTDSPEIKNLNQVLNDLIANKLQTRTRRFCAKAWDKTQETTFVLGNHLDCCLAADGSQAEAIVERRLDDAMPIHVVMDEDTNEPVCAAWLFWVVDKLDNKLKLVVNFIEMNHGYSNQTVLRETLVSNLLYFTGELYLIDVAQNKANPPIMIMRELNYGNIPNFTKFKSAVCMLDSKLGGFCSLRADKIVPYYLKALQQNDFHLYSLAELQLEFPNRVVIKAKSVESITRGTLFDNGVRKSAVIAIPPLLRLHV